jgi:hypothetical protein
MLEPSDTYSLIRISIPTAGKAAGGFCACFPGLAA